MTVFLCGLSLILGFVLGRIYAWMKYHYPEFQEKVKLDAARYRLQRAKMEADTEAERKRMDDILTKRIT